MTTKKNDPKPDESDALDESLLEAGGMGGESVKPANLEMPWLRILEQQSPQCTKGNVKYLSDAEAGDFCKTDTGDLWRPSIVVIACDFCTEYLEWPKKRGKTGPLNDYGENSSILGHCTRNEKNQYTLPNGNPLNETACWTLLLQNGTDWQRAIFQLEKTRLKASRKWLTAIRAEIVPGVPVGWKPPLFYRAWTLLTADDDNDQGDWKTFTHEKGERLDRLDDPKRLIAHAKAVCLDSQAERARFKPEPFDGPTIEAKANRPPPLTGAEMIGEPLPH
jgi:hypothetical protein